MEFDMKAVFGVLVASLSLVAGAAQAASVNNNAPSKTRAQVVAELHQAQAQGLISQNKFDYPVSLPASQHKTRQRSEEHTSELQSLMRISYAVFCLKKKKHQQKQ